MEICKQCATVNIDFLRGENVIALSSKANVYRRVNGVRTILYLNGKTIITDTNK